jgi:23S rRNA G2445 N2-methylase RlmL
MAADQFQYPEQEAKHELAPATIELANSTKLPDPAGSVDVVLCSPPYGTRIDYAMATRPELAVLGFHTEAIDQLRRQMLGTSTVEATINEARSEWGAPCTRYLAAVRSHPSKASASYYWKNQLQYFDGLYRSLQELRRVLRTAGHCFIVVQDSYYKELHLDLANIVKGMTRPFEWQLLNRFNYTSRRHMGRVHVGARKYQRPSTATESVLHFVSRV